jgi:hypothetical protein
LEVDEILRGNASLRPEAVQGYGERKQGRIEIKNYKRKEETEGFNLDFLFAGRI